MTQPSAWNQKGVREAAEDAVRALLLHQRLDHDGAEARHARGEPLGEPP